MRSFCRACLAAVLMLGACLPSKAPVDAGADLVPDGDGLPGDPGSGDLGPFDVPATGDAANDEAAADADGVCEEGCP